MEQKIVELEKKQVEFAKDICYLRKGLDELKITVEKNHQEIKEEIKNIGANISATYVEFKKNYATKEELKGKVDLTEFTKLKMRSGFYAVITPVLVGIIGFLAAKLLDKI
jgi:predicted RNase H-like nuclease (RuvC/YqgF family)